MVDEEKHRETGRGLSGGSSAAHRTVDGRPCLDEGYDMRRLALVEYVLGEICLSQFSLPLL
jgi:hypothetical protein